MSRILTFYGASDDLFVCEDKKKRNTEEAECYDGPASYKIIDENEGLIVVGHYAPSNVGCWSVGISPLDEDCPIPNWKMHWGLSESGYSTLLSIEVPDTATWRELKSE